MGDAADDLYFQEIKIQQANEKLEKKAQEIWEMYQAKILRWKSKEENGTQVHLMTTSHIINTKKLLERNKSPNPIQRKWIEIFRIELIKRQSDR